MKHDVNDKVIHCRNGVATIIGMKEMGDKMYYVVHTLRGDQENIYVPIEGSENIIRNVMSKEKANELLKELKDIKFEFNPNTKQRRDGYKRRLSSGNIKEIAFMFRQNNIYKKDTSIAKLGPSDLDMLKYASDIFLDEMSIIYDYDRENVEQFIETIIEQ